MSSSRTRKRPRSRRPDAVHKPRGAFHPRVQKVGPEHFGIVAIDCAKARSKWMLADFYGNVLVPPTTVDHKRPALGDAVAQLRQAARDHDLRDLLVALERTGRYHHTPRRAFADAGFETRIVHPFATSRLRQPADPGNKTDDTDLHAIHRAAVNGFALAEQGLDEAWTTFRLLIRHRRDLVQKAAALRTQIREHLDAAFPGFAAGFADLWDRDCAWHRVRHFATPADIRAAGRDGLRHSRDDARVRFQGPTLDSVLTGAAQAAPPDLGAALRRRFALALDDDRRQKAREIQALERDSAAVLARTPYVLLLSFPGVNVVSAADVAGEMGPIEHYANARTITGRAGLRPSRYQSDEVDRPNGPLVRCCNRKLRAAILRAADNLIKCNHHFNALATPGGSRARTRGTRASRWRCASAASPTRSWPAARCSATRACRAGTTCSTSSVPSTATMTPRRRPCCATCKPPSSRCRGRSTGPRRCPCTRSWRGSSRGAAAGRRCSATSCRLCWPGWASAGYNQRRQGRETSPSRVGCASRERLSSPRRKA